MVRFPRQRALINLEIITLDQDPICRQQVTWRTGGEGKEGR